MRWVTTVTWVWIGLLLFMLANSWIVRQPESCKGEAALGCGLMALLGLLAFGLFLCATPVVFALWVARFARWVSHRRDKGPGIGYTAPPPAPEPRPQYTITGRRIR